MSNWKTDFEVKFRLEFKHENGRKEVKNNTLIVEIDYEYILDFQYQTETFKKKINALLESNTICKIKSVIKK